MEKFKFTVKKNFRKLIHDEKFQKLALSTFMTIILFMVLFLSVSLIKFYNTSVKPVENGKLFYTFKRNTVNRLSDSLISSTDISEQFLSYNVSYGIDVSEWQGDIDWDKVAKTGISFAVIRCGFRQIDGSEIKEDSKFRENIVNARKAGLNVGVYFFGTAKNTDEAKQEAEFTVNLIKNYDINYPVVYDVETFNRGRLTGVDYSTLTDNILAFTDTIDSYGYASMVYSNRNGLAEYLDTGRLDGKLIWLAHYVESTDYTGNYNMWQYTDSGTVDGIDGPVDLNISYFTYVEDENSIVENPNYVKAPDVAFTNTDEDVISSSKTILRSSPSTTLPNKMRTLGYGVHMKRIGLSDTFSKILYNGRVVYVSNDELLKAR